MNLAVIIILFVASLFVAMCLHELGHFITSKRAGVKVEEFGIGIPPRIFGIKRGETIYSLNAIPIGAFVKAAGENDPTVPRSLAGKGPWTRLGIYAAGPLINIFLAFVLLSAFLALPYSVVASDGGIMVRAVVEDSPAEHAGIEPADVILEVGGQPIQNSADLSDMVNSVEEGTEISLTLLRDGQEVSKTLKPRFDEEQQQQVIGVYTGWNIVSQVDEASPSYEAGIRAEDTIYAINGQLIYNAEGMSSALESIPVDEEIDMVLLRGGNQTAASLTNAGYQTLPGVDMRWVEGADIAQERLPVWQAIYMGARYIIYMPVLIAQAIPLIIQRPDLALVGPIGAGQLTVEVVRTSGSDTILFMGGIISLGLGIFNLFPIPPLDGGGMLVALIEGFRHGKRLSAQKVRLAQYIGTVFLIALMVLITFSDLYRLISGKGFGL